MKKFPVIGILAIFLLSSFFCLLPSANAADENFEISTESSYKIATDGMTTVTQTVHIKNKSEFYFTPTYSVSVGFKDIQNVEATNSDGVIPTTISEKSPTNKNIKLSFPNRYAGMGKTNTFTLKFDTKDVARKQGEIWEVAVPGVSQPSDFEEYTTIVEVPDEFGPPSIIKPYRKSDSDKLVFTKDEIGKGGIYILYGEKQYFTFTLSYNITNPNLFPVRTEIALPPQTNYQNVIINSFSTPPINTTRDVDGNWIAEYRLLPQQKEKIIVKGVVEIAPVPKAEQFKQDNSKYLEPKKFWESKDADIVKITKTLKTPEDIYNYVSKTLSYNYSKVATETLRLGGKGALNDRKNSVCLEFTDLFVTLARAAGIPARSVEGFAYTQNSKLRPLLANDILHAWPEYYDKDTKKWIMVDPTWGNTTHDIDYFNTLDFQHVAFVIKGVDSEYPIPAGGYKFSKESKDVSVNFATKEDFVVREKTEIVSAFPSYVFPKTAVSGTFTVKNEGNNAISNSTVQVSTNYGSKRQFLLDYIPPGGEKKITTSFNDVPFLTNGNYIITIQVGKTISTKKIRISFIPELQQILFIGGIISGSAIIAAVTFHTGSVLVQRRKRKDSVRR